MKAILVVALFATALTSGLLSAVLGKRVRRLGARLESLARPLHELRGALAALELGLSFVERSSGSWEELNGYVDSLRLSLERATLGARDVDVLRRGEPAAADAKDHVDFNTLVLRSARAWSLLAPSYDASLEVDWRAGPVRVVGHAGRLQQALDNLIANALEHGGGRVFIEGELRGRIVRVLVSDGGRGIPDHLDEVLAEKGKRAASLTRRSLSARGHGLSIASEVIHEHEGRLGLGMGRNGPGLLVELPTTDGGVGAPGRVALRDARSHAYDRASKAA